MTLTEKIKKARLISESVEYPSWFELLDKEEICDWRIDIFKSENDEKPAYRKLFFGAEAGAMRHAFKHALKIGAPFNKHHIFVTKEAEYDEQTS